MSVLCLTTRCTVAMLCLLAALDTASAREANPVVRDHEAMAAGLYASMAFDGAATDVFLHTAPGARTDTVYLAIVPARISPSAFRGYRDIVPFAIARIHSGAETRDHIDAVIRYRVVEAMGRKAKVRDEKKDPWVRKIVAEISACAEAIDTTNGAGIASLSAALARLPAWPWGFPQINDKKALYATVWRGFVDHPSALPASTVRSAPSWCRQTP